MKRRGFLGFLGASAVASPSMAKKAAESAVTDSVPISGKLGVWKEISVTDFGAIGNGWGINSADEVALKIDKLRKLISGEENEEEHARAVAERKAMFAEHDINALGSVSGAHKVRMMIKARSRIRHEENKQYWWQQLSHLESSGR